MHTIQTMYSDATYFVPRSTHMYMRSIGSSVTNCLVSIVFRQCELLDQKHFSKFRRKKAE